MTRAYSESYLSDAARTLGEALEYAQLDLGLDPAYFMGMFTTGKIGHAFGEGHPLYVAGSSGPELALRCLAAAGVPTDLVSIPFRPDRTPAYWVGWILAYYQWLTGLSFARILELVSVDDLFDLYPTLHETSSRRAALQIDRLAHSRLGETRLAMERRRSGFSQAELAARSGVSLRAIQQYEQRAKDVNHAQAASIAALARVLWCTVEDLLEPVPLTIEELESVPEL